MKRAYAAWPSVVSKKEAMGMPDATAASCIWRVASATAPRAAADQLGHAKPSMTQDVYMGRKIAFTGAADVLAPLDVLS
jgi:integrase